jgi:hypothetical protein
MSTIQALPPVGPLRVLALETALEGEHPEVIATIQALARLGRDASERTVSRRTRAALNAGASADLIRLATGGPA